MLQTFKNGQGGIVLRVKLLDSSVTTGAGLTGLTSASSGLKISTIADNEATATAYTVAGSTIETITTLGTFAAPTATKCRFKEVDSTNHPGVYELHIADARFAVASAKSLLISISGATNLVQADAVVQLQSDDPYVAKPSNFASLSINGSGRVDVASVAGTAQTAGDIQATLNTVAGYLDTEVAAIKAKTDNLPASPAAVGSAMTLTSGERDSVADAMLDRNMATGTDSGSPTVRTVRQALRFMRNKWSISGTTLTVTKEDDATASWTSTVTATAGADPITGNDPA